MHIPDGFVSAPINFVTYAISTATMGFAMVRARRTLDERTTPLLGVTAAFVFAAQMLNFPVAGGTSGHFLGAVLAGILLGPLNACLVLGLVLIIQCLVFADGGLTALGSNILIMGVVGGIGGTSLYLLLRRVLPQTKLGFSLATAIASWASVVAASLVCAMMLALSGTSPAGLIIPAMGGVHALIGVGEALITTTVVNMVALARPDLLPAPVRGVQ